MFYNCKNFPKIFLAIYYWNIVRLCKIDSTASIESDTLCMKYLFLIMLTVTCSVKSGCRQQTTSLFGIIENNRFGYINKTGKVVIRPIYRSAGKFSEGLAPVRLHGAWGYIDHRGKMVIEAQYDYAMPFRDGRALVHKDGKPYFIDHSGKVLFEHAFAQMDLFNAGRAIVQGQNGKYGIIDSDGRLVADTGYSRIVPAGHHSYIMHDETDQVGLLNNDGQWLVPFGKYATIKEYRNGFAYFTKEESAGDSIGGAGFLDTAGKVVYFRRDDEKSWMRGDAANGMTTTSFAHTDQEGEERYYHIYPFSNGRAFVSLGNNELRIISHRGTFVGEHSFESVFENQFFNHIALVQYKGKYGGIDTNGNFIFKPEFYDIYAITGDSNHFIFKDINSENREYEYGIATMQGKVIYPPSLQYVDASGFGNGLILAVKNNRYTWIDSSGKIIWQSKTPDASWSDTLLNIDYMNRGYFYAAVPDHIKIESLGGFGGSGNVSKSISNGIPVKHNNNFSVVIDTTARAKWKGQFAGYTVYVINASGDTVFFDAQDSRLYMVVQAQDRQGSWKDIEYLPGSWCGNSYHTLLLSPGDYWSFTMPKYTGDIKTKLRVRLEYKTTLREHLPKFIYSNAVTGSVNPGQFWRRPGYTPSSIMDPYFE